MIQGATHKMNRFRHE